MSTEQFDGLTRKLAGGISRRRALRLLGGAVVGAALSRTRVLPGAHGGVPLICTPPFPVGTSPVSVIGRSAAGRGGAV